MKQAMGKGRGGMTMIEMIVALALAAIFFAALIGVVAPVYRTYQRTRAASDAQMLAGNIIDAIRTSADRADSLAVSEGAVQVGVIRYTVSADGRLLYTVAGTDETERGVFDEKFYHGNTIAMQAEQLSTPNTIRVTITVTTRDGVRTSQSGVISTLRQYIQGSTSEQGEPPPEGGDEPPPGGGGSQTPTIDANNLYKDALALAHDVDDFFQWVASWFERTRTTPKEFYDEFYLNKSQVQIDVSKIITAKDLDKAWPPNTRTAQQTAMYNKLLDPNHTFYLSVYFTQRLTGSVLFSPYYVPVPIVYVTDEPSADFTVDRNGTKSDAGDVYLVYDISNVGSNVNASTWYLLDPSRQAPDTALYRFDERDNKGVSDYLKGNDYQKIQKH